MYPLQALKHCNQPYKEDGLIREGVFEEVEEEEENIHVIHHQRISKILGNGLLISLRKGHQNNRESTKYL